MDLTSLYHTFPKELHNFFSEIKDFNFKLAIVGGFCRDYLKYQTLSKDLDLEIRPLNMQPGIINTVELYEFLSKKYETELLNFNILRVKIGEYECEISLPRLEEFNSNFSHSNFDVEFIQDLDYTLGPIRRDFTLNAIYFEYGDNFSVIDPLEGIAHLKASKLVACSKSFGRDPVRFLRLLRFMIKEDFSADELLLSQFKKIPLTAYSAHYLKLESIKSTKPLTFLLEIMGGGSSISESISESIAKWDINFNGDLSSHIILCPFINVKEIENLLTILKMSLKTIFLFPKSISFDRFIESDPKLLLALLTKLEQVLSKQRLSDDNFELLFKTIFTDFSIGAFLNYYQKTYSLTAIDLERNKKEYPQIILKNRLGIS